MGMHMCRWRGCGSSACLAASCAHMHAYSSMYAWACTCAGGVGAAPLRASPPPVHTCMRTAACMHGHAHVQVAWVRFLCVPRRLLCTHACVQQHVCMGMHMCRWRGCGSSACLAASCAHMHA